MSDFDEVIDALTVVEKAYGLDLDKIDEGYLMTQTIVHADSRGKAKTKIMHELRYDDLKLCYTDAPVTFLNVPISRVPECDKVDFAGEILTKEMVRDKLRERERHSELDAILENPETQYCYIMKGGYYYRPNSCGYTDRKYRAGIYTKEYAVSDARSCSELRIIPIDVSEHNQMLTNVIEDMMSRMITVE